MEWLILIFTLLFGYLVTRYVLWRKSHKLKKLGVLHPKPWPVIGNITSLVCLRSHLTEMMCDIYKFNEEADYVGFYSFTDPIILIRSPNLIKNIVIKNFDHFTDHTTFLDPELNSLFSKNLASLRGEKWRKVRNLLSPAFTGSKMKSMFKLITKCGQNFVDYLVEVQSQKPELIESKETFTRYTNDVIASCAFGVSVDSMRNPKNEFYLMGREVSNFGGLRGIKIVLARLLPNVFKLFKLSLISPKTEVFFENLIKETIAMREKEGITRPDMIQLMMESRGKKCGGENDDHDLTIQEMTAQAFVFFLGGFETSATVMCFVAHEIAGNPDIQTRLRNEIDDVMTETNGDVTYEAINGMPYLDAVVNETLRIYPIGLIVERMCVKTFELPPALPGAKPITIEPGQTIWFPVFSVHRDPKYYPNPEKFDPERFMSTSKTDIDPFTYIPFGQGPRMCIGNRFALLEIKVLVFHLLAKCYIKPGPKARWPVVFNKKDASLMPKEGFGLEIEPRNTSVDE
ncbi:cytochrome P450 9e2-like [Venturia canescens]|uniref:cytochrome P450 9e2-like n=1 Tax=Venturia canescens TaxID=32260 RepID=UPI001C9C178F|nr:cytochrome P450 9e2-like [Venturia canescens]